jgi:MFS family permease
VSRASAPVMPQLGLRANLPQFALLMLINAFVGGMVGLERTVVPLLGTETFGLRLNTVVVSFIVSFGVVKALVNLLSGALADRFGRKHILVGGWLVGLPVPFLLIFAPSWSWIVAANVLLGINQGLCWSMAVVMKIDLVGPKGRGLAVGLNEFAGYLALGLTALATGYLASVYGLRPVPFYLGIGYAVLGLLLSWLLMRETQGYTRLEQPAQAADGPAGLRQIFARTSWGDRRLFAACQAGLVNNLNDGMSWGILPLFFVAHGLDVEGIGVLKFVYPAVWGVGQIVTGPLSDRASPADRLGDDRAGRRDRPDRRDGQLFLVAQRQRAAGPGHGHGLPGADRGGERRGAAGLARAGAGRLPLLARLGLRGGRALGRRPRRSAGAGLGRQGCRRADPAVWDRRRRGDAQGQSRAVTAATRRA